MQVLAVWKGIMGSRDKTTVEIIFDTWKQQIAVLLSYLSTFFLLLSAVLTSILSLEMKAHFGL